jgi:hypothetical protein
MYLSVSYRLLLTTILFALSWSASALANPSVSITPSGDSSSYSVQGSGMDGIAGIQLEISYDTNSLASPTVTQGGLVAGAMLAANTSRPGSIKIAIISTREFSGSGQIASISFATKIGSSGITVNSISMINSKGSSVSSTTGTQPTEATPPGMNPTPGVPFSQTSQANPTSQTAQTSTPGQTVQSTTTATTSLGTVILPTEQQQVEVKPASPHTPPSYTGDTPATSPEEPSQPPVGKTATEAKAEETSQYVVYKGVYERFKQYDGSKTLSAMTTLFEKKVAQTIDQQPAVLLSDGQSKATLTIDIPDRIGTSPNFAVHDGTLLSFKRDKMAKNRWVVEILPETGSLFVTMTIIAGTEEFEYPLTVAPPVKTSLTLDEQGWDTFLKEIATASAPLHDFNNDAVRDYQDEFIFVANYLVSTTVSAKPASVEKASPKR